MLEVLQYAKKLVEERFALTPEGLPSTIAVEDTYPCDMAVRMAAGAIGQDSGPVMDHLNKLSKDVHDYPFWMVGAVYGQSYALAIIQFCIDELETE